MKTNEVQPYTTYRRAPVPVTNLLPLSSIDLSLPCFVIKELDAVNVSFLPAGTLGLIDSGSGGTLQEKKASLPGSEAFILSFATMQPADVFPGMCASVLAGGFLLAGLAGETSVNFSAIWQSK